MPLVDDTDINVHLPEDKLTAENAAGDLEAVKDDAERVIRGYLAGFVNETDMATWLTPDDTPGVIRAIGGRLCAAFIYRLRYSEDSLDDPEYAQFKYNEAISMLQGIINGSIAIEGVDPLDLNSFTGDMIYPSDADTDPAKFTMSSQF